MWDTMHNTGGHRTQNAERKTQDTHCYQIAIQNGCKKKHVLFAALPFLPLDFATTHNFPPIQSVVRSFFYENFLLQFCLRVSSFTTPVRP